MDVGTVIAVAKTLIKLLNCSQLKEIVSMLGYKSQLEGLERTVSTIIVMFRDAEMKEGLSNEAQHWIDELKDAVFEADDLLDEFVTLAQSGAAGSLSKKVKHFFSVSNNQLSVAFRMSQGVKNIKKKLDAIAENSNKFGFKIDSDPIRKRRTETCSYMVAGDIIGREEELEKIVGVLLDSDVQHAANVCFLTIWGIGGLGKTALAQLLYNHPRVRTSFPLMMWSCVSDQGSEDLNVKEVLGKIMGSVNDKRSTMEALQRQLAEKLHGKKYLLVLDDVWTEKRHQWWELVKYLKGGERGSWVVVTSRSNKTATIVGGSTYELQGLSEINSRCLFEKSAFALDDGKTPPDDLVEIGRQIVDGYCARVPLAIRVTGSLLFGQEKSKWESVRDIGLASISHKKENDIMSILKLSFDHLESPLKSCFSYCALFPKDFVIDKKLLINLWMAQGFIVPFDNSHSIEDAGEEYFSILLKRCFFQDIKYTSFGEIESCKIHDLMHDIAQRVSGREIYVADTIKDKIDKKARHLSLTSKKEYGKYSSGKTHIRSFLFVGLSHCNSEQFMVKALVKNFRSLRALDMRELDLKSLSNTIGKLLHLRYLDLSYNYNLVVLPKSITKLYNLQTLNLYGCSKLKELPKDLSEMVNLRHIDILGCNELTCMPRGMGKLSCLYRLSHFKVGLQEKQQVLDELEDLKDLKNLKGCLNIVLGSRVLWEYAGTGNSRKKKSYMKTKKHLNQIIFDFSNVSISFDRESEENGVLRFMKDMQPHVNVKVLYVWEYKGVRMPDWVTRLKNVVKIMLRDGCLRYLPCLGNLCNLKDLELRHLPTLNYINFGSSSSTKVTSFFPSLEVLSLTDLPNFKGWYNEAVAGVEDESSSPQLLPCFPQLKILTINKCQKVTCIPMCPVMEELDLQSFNEKVQGIITKISPSISSSSSSTHITPKLRRMVIDNNEWLNSLRTESLECLEYLKLVNISMLKNLPSCLQFLTHLRTFELVFCPRLEAMPDWMPKLTSLKEFYVRKCSKILESRCQRNPPGEDWPYIQHIPNIKFIMK